MLTESPIGADWTPPAVPELKIIERDGRWLCLNPEVPAWIVTTKAGAILLQLADGERTVQDYHDFLTNNEILVHLSQLTAFFQSAVEAKLFEMPSKTAESGPWESRKLTALYLHITNRCNLQCSYCYRESSPHLPIVHDARRFCDMLEYIRSFAAPRLEVTFSGGEPLMHPGFRDIAEASTRQGYRNVLLTNGTLLSKDGLVDFVHDHFVRVKISLDGPNEEIHSRTRGKGNFEKVVKNIEKLLAKGVRVSVQVTITKRVLPYVDDIKTALPERPNLRFVFTPMFPMGRGAVIETDCIDNDEFYSFSRGHDSPVRYVPGGRARGCGAGAGNLSIADTGDVYPCHLFHFDEFRLGNIFHDSFEQIFFGEKIRDYVQSMDVERNNPTCKACEVRFLCGGGCHGNTLYSIGDFHGPDACCSFLKNKFLDNLFRQTVPRESGAEATAF
jgi:radical SAM protein with 4Fe4S-binding SPASM domain